MKSVIMDMKDITLSKEVYDRKPSLFFALFIYGLVFLIIIALVWAYFGRIDIVIRAQGIIRPYSQTAVIINSIGGEVRYVNFYEGSEVTEGDVLFEIDTFHMENEKRILEGQINSIRDELMVLNLFHDSVVNEENLLMGVNEEFSARFEIFMVSMNAIDHGAVSHLQQLSEEESALNEAINYARFELSILNMFERSVLNGYASFGGAVRSGRRTEIRNTYLTQFLSFEAEMDGLRQSINITEESVFGYRWIRDEVLGYYSDYSVEQPIILNLHIYRSMLEEHVLQINQLTERYYQAREQFEIIYALYNIGTRPLADLTAAEIVKQNAYSAIHEVSSQFLLSIDNQIRVGYNQLNALINQKETLRLGVLASISSQALSLETSVFNMNQTLASITLQKESLFFVGDEAGDAAMLRLNEINHTLGRINALEIEYERLRLLYGGIQRSIDESVVTAPISGIVVVHTELTQAVFVPGGVQVLTILPEREYMLSTNIFISNNDIGRISEGMTVSYDIAAMPRREFGEITGEITRISTDISMEEGAAGFFIVESGIEDRVFENIQGDEVSLRIGMGFEARIIVDRQRILFYLLERLDLMIRGIS